MKVLLSIIMIAATLAMISCGGDGSAGKADATPTDSQMIAEHVDPSTKFPQQVIATDTLQADANFVDNAIQSAEETVGLADLAVKKASHDNVKKIAQNIARDQQQLLSDLRKQQKPKEAEDTSKRFTDGRRAELEKLAGTAFDRQWVEKMVTSNAAGISRYEVESGAAKDKSVKKLVDDALPKLKDHQQQLETCRAKLQ
jgi:predicted outer membrane protein